MVSYLPSGKELSDIAKIEFEYKNVPAGFKISTKPTITAMVRSKQPDDPDATLTNTLRLSYEYTDEHGTTTKYPQDAGEAERYVSVSEIGYYMEITNEDKLNKDVLKLRGSSGTGKAEKDLLEYTVFFRNVSGERVQDPFFDDTYVGQKPYLADTYNTLSAYGTAPFIKVVSVTNAAGKDVTTARGLSISSYYVSTGDGDKDPAHYDGLDPILPANTMRIRLNGELDQGDLVKVSYVMEVTTNTGEVRNNFKAWAYPIGGGGPRIIYIGNGHVKPGAVSSQLPTVAYSWTIRDSANADNTATNPAAVDDLLDYTLNISNSSPYFARTFTINSILQQLNYDGTSYSNVTLKPDNAANQLLANIVHYNKDGTAIDTRNNVEYTVDPTPNWKSTDTTNPKILKGGFLLGDNPIELQPGEKLVVTYKIKINNVADPNKNPYENIGPTITFQETRSDFANYSSIYNISSIYDGFSTTKSWVGLGSKNIYAKRNAGIYAGMSYGSNSSSILNGATPFTGRTGNYTPYFYVYNYSDSQPLEITKLIIRMPAYETVSSIHSTNFTGLNTSSFNIDTISQPGEPQVVAVTRKDGNKIVIPANGSGYLRFYTAMTAENNALAVADNVPASLNASYSQKNYEYHAAFYSDQIVSATNSNQIEPKSGSEWGTAQSGNLYGSTSKAYLPLTTLFVSPGITARPMKISAPDTYEAIGSAESVTIGQRVAWEVTVKNYNNGYVKPTMTTPYVVIKLPVGMAYGNKMVGAQAVNTYTVGGQNFVVAKLENVTGSTPRTFTIESTGSSNYGDMQAEIFLVSNDLFYNVFSTGNSSSGNGSRVAPTFLYSDLGIPSTAYQDYVLSTSAKINVSGLFAFTSTMKVQLFGGATATSTGTDTVESPRDGKNFTYTMTLKNGGNTMAYQDLVMINRMPNKDDKYNMSDMLKGSNTPVTMESDPVVKLNGTALSASAYTVTYTNAGPNHAFGHGDYGNGTPTTTWSATRATASAFRIEFTDPLAAGATLEVSFQSKADPATIPYKNAIAVDTFGFGFNAKLSNNDLTWVTSEAVPVKVTFPNLNPAVIKGTLFEDDNTNGILDSGELGYTGGEISLDLINASDVIVQTTKTDSLTGEYSFSIETPGAYTVRIASLPTGYAVFDTIKTEVQGNKFKYDTLVTEAITVAIEQTYIANAALVPDVAGELTISKLVTGDSRVGSVNQPFLFRIDYTPTGASETITFYEVIKGPGSRTIVDLPRGTYTVTEISDWSTGFSPETGTTVGGLNITYTQSKISASFTNKRDVENYFHAIDTETNKFKK